MDRIIGETPTDSFVSWLEQEQLMGVLIWIAETPTDCFVNWLEQDHLPGGVGELVHCHRHGHLCTAIWLAGNCSFAKLNLFILTYEKL